MTPEQQSILQAIPSVTSLLSEAMADPDLSGIARAPLVSSIRAVLEDTRGRVLAGSVSTIPSGEELLRTVRDVVQVRSAPSLRRVINATGVVLHTGLGRAPLSDAVVASLVAGAAGYCNLEFDLESGTRGRRIDHVNSRLARLTGAEAALAVNNNAAATLLILQTFATGREVVVSRGELIEIGGSYRLPDVMRASGVTLKEVGTTNRTRISDYADAIGDETAMLFKAHTSNYRVIGFTESVRMDALSALGRERGILTVDDIGSGAMVDPSDFGLDDEPTVRDSLAAGADLVCFSGDKLLGGPQCGIILGSKGLLKKIEKNPLMRTYRLDKLVLLALESTLSAYDDRETAREAIPTLRMLSAPAEQLQRLGADLSERLNQAVPGESFDVVATTSFAGGGTLPQRSLPSTAVAWHPNRNSPDHYSRLLRLAPMPVVTRIEDDAICFDMRTIRPEEFDEIVSAVRHVVAQDS